MGTYRLKITLQVVDEDDQVMSTNDRPWTNNKAKGRQSMPYATTQYLRGSDSNDKTLDLLNDVFGIIEKLKGVRET